MYPIDGVDYGGITITSHTDGNLYLFGNSGSSGVKVAKVPWDSVTETSKVCSDICSAEIELLAQTTLTFSVSILRRKFKLVYHFHRSRTSP